jgi:hypothetical protein
MPHKDPREARSYQLKRKYGIDIDQYDAIKEVQGGKCALCRVATGKARALAVDHDHATGEVRGLLCLPCNHKGLGWVEKISMERLAAYLSDPPARKVLGA